MNILQLSKYSEDKLRLISVMFWRQEHEGPQDFGTVYRGHCLIERKIELQTLEEESTFICYK